jgi:hypothetical protein
MNEVLVAIQKCFWAERFLILVPTAIAALLTGIMFGVEFLHLPLNYIVRYVFVFYGPWARLGDISYIADHVHIHNERLAEFAIDRALVWIPAVLYSVCLLSLLVVLRITSRRILNRLDPDTAKTLARRTVTTSSIIIIATMGWFAVKLCWEQIACNRRGAEFELRYESIKHDADEKLTIGSKSGDVSRFFAEHGIPVDFSGAEATGTLHTIGCGPFGCGTDSALIGVRVKLDSAGAVAAKPSVVNLYTDCL